MVYGVYIVEKGNLKQFSIRQQYNMKRMKGYEYFSKAHSLYISKISKFQPQNKSHLCFIKKSHSQ